jgi:predicted secreted protein
MSRPRRIWHRSIIFAIRWVALFGLLVPLLVACTTSDDEGDEETSATSTPTATTTATAVHGTTTATAGMPAAATQTPATEEPVPPATLDPGTSQVITDRVCQARVPLDWVETGAGRGTTPSGARFELFGNRLTTDDDWQAAVELLLNQAKARPGATVEQDETFVRVVYADQRGFVYRARFPDRYCDFSVTSLTGPIPAAERAFWDAIIATLTPAE